MRDFYSAKQRCGRCKRKKQMAVEGGNCGVARETCYAAVAKRWLANCGGNGNSSWELYKCTNARRATKEPLTVGSS